MTVQGQLTAGQRVWVESPYPWVSDILGTVLEYVEDAYNQEWFIVCEETHQVFLLRGWTLRTIDLLEG